MQNTLLEALRSTFPSKARELTPTTCNIQCKIQSRINLSKTFLMKNKNNSQCIEIVNVNIHTYTM